MQNVKYILIDVNFFYIILKNFSRFLLSRILQEKQSI